MWRLDGTLAGSIPRQRRARSACDMYERPVGVARKVLAQAFDPPYDFIVVGVIKQGASRGYDECALTPAEAMVLPSIAHIRHRSLRGQKCA